MRTIAVSDLDRNPRLLEDIAQILRDDGLIIFPGRHHYRIGAHALSKGAVNRLLQSKRRVQTAPALVFVSDRSMLKNIVDEVPPLARDLMDAFWPGPLTIRLRPGEGVPSKIRKALAKATGTIGFRVPSHPVAKQMVEAFGGPLLVSSANRSKKVGSHSVAQVRKYFGRFADLLIDAGDLGQGKASTVIDVEESGWSMVRESAVSSDEIDACLQG